MFLIFIMMNLIDIAGCAISTRVYIDLPTWALVNFSNKIKPSKNIQEHSVYITSGKC